MSAPMVLRYGSIRTGMSSQTLKGYVDELCELLGRSPVRLDLQPIPLDSEDLDAFKALPEDVIEALGEFAEQLTIKYGNGMARVIVVINNDHPLATSTRQHEPHALYGCNVDGRALVYGNIDRRVIWHEALHTLGAEDCYDEKTPEENPGPTCGFSNCIMQYIPTRISVGKWPFLCQENIERVQESCPEAQAGKEC
jgi:hypothetical protein